MGNPDPYQNPGQHPGGQNYPVEPGGYQPTRPVERDAHGETRGFDGAYPPPPPAQSGYTSPPQGAYPPPQGDPYGGYQLGYGPGAYGPGYGPQDGAQPPQGPPPDWQGPGGGNGGGDGGGDGNKKLIWIAVMVVVFVLVLAGIVIAVVKGGSTSQSTASEQTTQQTTTRTTTAPSTSGGVTLPSGIPSDISIPPIFGGSTTGPNVKKWEVEVTGEGTAQLIAVGIPDTNALGSQQLPWSKSFSTDTFLVTVTVLDPKPGTTCKITRDGAVVADETASESGPLICTGSR